MEKNEQAINNSGQGRLPGNEQEKEKVHLGNSRDISQIDRQEGDMEHGELGGNFKKENDEKREH
jgi:hypothetical protein